MNIREHFEQTEMNFLNPYASFSSRTLGRKTYEKPCEIRTEYQRDRDRIVRCKAFRRLKHKTQVFISPKGDHYRTRLTHTLEVSQIARTVARALRFNEDLTEAVSLGHDLGHTPFGHAGESALNELYAGGFKHYEQSVRVLEVLEKDGEGLNITKEVLDGVLRHTKGTSAFTPEGRIVRVCDRIAYVNHDIEDAMRAGMLTLNDIPIEFTQACGDKYSARINTLVGALITNSKDDNISLGSEIEKILENIHKFMYDEIYLNKKSLEEDKKVPFIIKSLFEYFKNNYKKMPISLQEIAKAEGLERAVCDYIAGMSDRFATDIFQQIFIPRSVKVL